MPPHVYISTIVAKYSAMVELFITEARKKRKVMVSHGAARGVHCRRPPERPFSPTPARPPVWRHTTPITSNMLKMSPPWYAVVLREAGDAQFIQRAVVGSRCSEKL